LFNLSADPGETKNLADQNPEELQQLADMLAKTKSTPVTRPQ
jgi:hypothetical protein